MYAYEIFFIFFPINSIFLASLQVAMKRPESPPRSPPDKDNEATVSAKIADDGHNSPVEDHGCSRQNSAVTW